MRKLTLDQISSITILLNEGKKVEDISRIVGCGKSTVAKYGGKSLDHSSSAKRGRPGKLTSRDKRALARMVANGGTKTAIEEAKTFNLERQDKVSPTTVRRALKEQGLKAVKRVKKPKLSRAHKRARLQWASEHENWTLEDWKRIVWSDETKINRLNSDGIRYAWSKKPESYPPEAVQEMLKFGGGSVMIWGCMSWLGAGGMSPVVGRMNSEQLIGILNTSLVPTVEEVANKLFSNDRNHVLFQQDNDAKHTSGVTKNWLASTGIQTMKWPSQSPDLNPIEHLWCLVKRRLGEYEEPPSSLNDLMKRVDEVWKNIHENSCQTLIESMPSRVAAVIRARGGHTRY